MKNGKHILVAILIFPVFYLTLPWVQVCAYEESEDPIMARDLIREDLSGKTDAELIEIERKLKTKQGLEPGNADLYYRLSTVYATLFDRTRTQKGQQYLEWLVKSRDALEKVLMIRPEDKVAHYNLGVVYKRLGQMERAREELKKAIRLCDPGKDVYLLCASWMQIGAVYEEKGFLDEAKEAYLKAREFDYENPNIQEAIRHVDALRKNPKEGGGSMFGGIPSVGNSLSTNPQTAAAMGLDPNAQGQGGVAQALPALGQALMQKFGGGGGNTSDQN